MFFPMLALERRGADAQVALKVRSGDLCFTMSLLGRSGGVGAVLSPFSGPVGGVGGQATSTLLHHTLPVLTPNLLDIHG